MWFGVGRVAFFYVGHRFVYELVYGLADFSYVHAYYPHAARFVQAVDGDVYGFVYHEVCYERIQRFFPAKDKAGGHDDDAVYAHYGLADRKHGDPVYKNGDGVGAVYYAAVAHHHPYAYADYQAAKDRCQYGYIGQAVWYVYKGQGCQRSDAYGRIRSERPAKLLIPQENERYVQHYQKQP